jgi:hypothetical protein
MLIPTDGRLPHTSQTAAIDLDRIAANAGGAGVGQEVSVTPLSFGVTPVPVMFIWDGTSRKSLGH